MKGALDSQQMSLPWWDDSPPVVQPTPSAISHEAGAGVLADALPPVLSAGLASDVEAGSKLNGAGRLSGPDALGGRAPPNPGSSSPGDVHPEPRPGNPEGLPVFRHPHAQHEIRLGDALVAFELKRVRRRSIGMVVGLDGLSVRAPRWVGWPEIEQALQDKARWICTKLVEQRTRERQQAAARIEWREGASIPVLGDSVILVLDARLTGVRLHEEAQALPGVARKTLHLGLPQHATPEQIRDTVTAWLQRHAHQWFEQRVAFFASQLGVSVSRLSLSSARTRWGSASADGSIRLHWRLIHFGPAIVDYVVAHELAHLREMNHSPRFWGVVRSVLPDYDAAREQLRHAVIPD